MGKLQLCSFKMRIYTYNRQTQEHKTLSKAWQAQRVRIMYGVHEAINWR